MILAYQRECSSMRVKPVTKLLEQLEVCTACVCVGGGGGGGGRGRAPYRKLKRHYFSHQ